jgi:hypothetical protein
MTVVSMGEREFSWLDVFRIWTADASELAKRVIYWVSSGGRCFGF